MGIGLGLGISMGINGASSGGGGGGFDPATLGLDGWWRAPYSGLPWGPTASAGTSGSNGNLSYVSLGSDPGVGTAVNGKTPASFNGTSQAVELATATSTSVITQAAGTIIVLANASAAVAAATDYYDDPTLFGASSGNAGLSFTSSGVRAGVFNSTTKQTTAIAQATGAWFMAAMRWDSTNVKCRVNSTDATPVSAVGGAGALGAQCIAGQNYNGAKWFHGLMLEIMTAKTALLDADLANIKSYFNSRYALSL